SAPSDRTPTLNRSPFRCERFCVTLRPFCPSLQGDSAMMSLDRRQLLRSLAGAGALATLDPAAPGAERDRERIKAENDREGTTDWQLTYTRVAPRTNYRSTLIEGFVSRASVRAGDRLDFFISTDPSSPFVIDLYRLGYYQGKGGRHVRRL